MNPIYLQIALIELNISLYKNNSPNNEDPNFLQVKVFWPSYIEAFAILIYWSQSNLFNGAESLVSLFILRKKREKGGFFGSNFQGPLSLVSGPSINWVDRIGATHSF